MYTTIENDKGEVVFYGSNFDLWDDYISHAEHEDKKKEPSKDGSFFLSFA